MIKTMLTLRPALSQQAILSYFTRPGRDINHARIIDIVNGTSWAWIPPAPLQATLDYMSARQALPYPRAANFLAPIGAAAPISARMLAVQLTCWPVGQGLFMSGRLQGAAGRPFNWVYDCGSVSNGSFLTNAVGDMRREIAGADIDLLTLSHFDADHINGVVQLVGTGRIRTLLLPYLPLWQRLLVALEEGIAAGDPLFEFFIDPVAFLTGIDGGGIGQIVFVPAAGPDDAAPPLEIDPEPDRPIEGAKIEEGKPPEDHRDDLTTSGASPVPVRFIRPGGRIVIPSWWEFVPYNDARMRPYADPGFVSRAKRVADILVGSPHRRADALKALKKIYDRAFGRSARRRNVISLFLYSGAIDPSLRLRQFAATHPISWNSAGNDFAQMYSGDGYLHRPARLDALLRFYGNDRIDRAGVVQIMHHGARGNWHPGVAAALSPAVSIFSSDPGTKQPAHPHAEVIRDFWPNCPVQVDTVGRFRVTMLVG